MKKYLNKNILAILLALGCVLIVAGASILIYDALSNPTQSSTSIDDDEWTDNY